MDQSPKPEDLILSTLNTYLNTLKEQKAALANRLQEVNSRVEALESEKLVLEEKIAQVEREYSVIQQSLNELNELLSTNEQKVQHLNQQQLEHREKLLVISKQLAVLVEQKKTLEQQLQEIKIQLENNEEKLEDIESKKAEVLAQLEENAEEQTRTSDLLSEKQEKSRLLSDSINSKIAAIRENEAKLNTSRNNHRQISEQIAQTQSEISRSEERQRQLEAEISNLKNLIAGLELAINLLLVSSVALDAIGMGEVARIAIKALQIIKDGFERKLVSLVKQCDTVKKFVEQNTLLLQQKRTDESEETSEIGRLELAVRSLAEERQQLDNQLEGVNQEVATLAATKAQLATEKKSLDGLKRRLDQQEKREIKRSDWLSWKLAEVNGAIESTQSQCIEVEARQTTLDEALKNAAKDLRLTEEELKATKAKHTAMKLDLEEKKSSLTAVLAERDSIEEVKNEILKENRDITAQIYQVEEQYSEVERKIATKTITLFRT